MPDSYENVVHLAPTVIAEALETLGATRVVPYPDQLSHGPSRLDPKQHRANRLEYWDALVDAVYGEEQSLEFDDAYLSTEQLGSAATQFSDFERYVVWTTPTWSDRLFCWFCFYALKQQQIPARKIATAEPRFQIPGEGSNFVSLHHLDPEQLAEGFDDLFYPKPVYFDAGARLWKTFASASPRKFAITVSHTTKFFPDLPELADDYGALFPRQVGPDPSRLSLSDFDEALFYQLDPDWSGGTDLFGHHFLRDYSHLSEIAIVNRLLEWSQFPSVDEPAVDYRRRADSPDPLERFEFRANERARRILEHGLASGQDAPTLPVGNNRLYTATAPWTKTIRDENWWFERFDP